MFDVGFSEIALVAVVALLRWAASRAPLTSGITSSIGQIASWICRTASYSSTIASLCACWIGSLDRVCLSVRMF